MKSKIYTVVLLSAAVIIQACSSDNKSGTDSSDTATIDAIGADTSALAVKPIHADQFVKKATEGGYKLIEAAKIAQKNGMDPMIDIFAGKIIEDHTTINERISSIAKELKITPPSVLSSNDQADIDLLKPLSGKKFDKQYMDMMAKEYRSMVILFNSAAASTDVKVSAFAKEELRKIQEISFMAGDVRFNLKP